MAGLLAADKHDRAEVLDLIKPLFHLAQGHRCF